MNTPDSSPLNPASEEAQAEAIALCAELIRFDTSNPTSNERACADWVVGCLAEVGIESVLIESAPGRANVIARIAGTDPGRGALLVHGHLDVVPADASEWQVPPFSGEIRDGYLWGRGAIDMKDTVAVMLATARFFARTGTKPSRDLVLAFLADEEAGGRFGAHWLVEHRPELFAGVTEAIGEGGGFSFAIDDTRRLYPIENAQRGMAWMELTATGRAGHGSSPNAENAVTDLAESLTRIGRHTFPIRLIEPVRALLEEAARLRGIHFDENDIEEAWPSWGRYPTSCRSSCATRRTRPCSTPATRRTSFRGRPPPGWTGVSCPATSRS